jgi:hypothetical protein
MDWITDAMGIITLPWSTATGMAISTLEPQWPPLIPTPDNVLNSATVTGSTVMFLTPLFVEVRVFSLWRVRLYSFGVQHWARDEKSIAAMKAFDHIVRLCFYSAIRPRLITNQVFAGAPMSQGVGDALVAQGISLVPFYGS